MHFTTRCIISSFKRQFDEQCIMFPILTKCMTSVAQHFRASFFNFSLSNDVKKVSMCDRSGLHADQFITRWEHMLLQTCTFSSTLMVP